MIVENLYYKTIYPNMKKYVEANSKYAPLVTKKYTNHSKQFPIVPTKLLPVTNKYGTLDYGDEIYTFGIEINVYSIDLTIDNKVVSGESICNEVTSHIIKYFKDNYKVTIKVELDAPDVDSSIHRNIIRVTGRLETKYGLDKPVIYPN